MKKEIEKIILETINECLIEKGFDAYDALPLEQIILDSDLDSMDLAIIVSELEAKLGYDPFTLIDEPIYPETFNQFLDIYIKYS